MTSTEYFRAADGRRIYYSWIEKQIRQHAPETVGKHISVQLDAIGLREAMEHGNTPFGLPFTFAVDLDEAAT